MAGKSDSARRKDDGQYDLEQQFILRLPPGQAMALSHAIETGATLKDNLFIDIQPDERWGKVQYGGEILNAKMVDLPCIVETLKTTDNKTFYKTADISQMLICSPDLEPSDDEDESPKKKKEKDKKYRHPHGLCPPLKNVRKRRFRKTLTKKPIDLASIEKEVKRLLRMDIAATKVEWEEIFDDSQAGNTEKDDTEPRLLSQGDVSASYVDEQSMFGEISSSDDGEVNIDDESDVDDINIAPIKSISSTMASRLASLEEQRDALKDRIRAQEKKVASVSNFDLKSRFEMTLNELREDLMEKESEIEQLVSSAAGT